MKVISFRGLFLSQCSLSVKTGTEEATLCFEKSL